MAGIDRLARFAAGIIAFVLLTAAGPPPPQAPAPEQRALSAPSERRIALVVGNSAYRNTVALANPLNDARDLAAALERTGFDVIVALDTGKAEMDGALRAFANKLAQADVALFYYAGHGLQVGRENYLVPVDARLKSERDLEFEAVKLDFVLRQMEIDREGKTTIVLLDACRDNPLSRNLARSMGTRSAAIGQGLAPASTGVGTFIAYSTQPGNVALDGKGRNSPFTGALLANIPKRGLNLNATMIQVRRQVIKATAGRQVPWDHSAMTGDFYFVPGQLSHGTTTAAPAAQSDDVAALKARLKALELEAQQRRSASAANALPPGPPPALIAKLAELRVKLDAERTRARDLQLKLLEARRTEGQARDTSEKNQLRSKSIEIQRDMTKASLAARRLKEELDKLEPQVITPGSPLDLKPSRTVRGFDIYDNAMLAGDKIKFGAADSVAGCTTTCRNTPGCVAGEFNPAASKRDACSVYRRVTRLQPSTTGTSAYIKQDPGSVASRIPVQPPPGANLDQVAFELSENVRIEGARVRDVYRAPNPDACRRDCAASDACVAFQHGRKNPVMGQCHLFSSVATRHQDRAWRSGLRANPATAAKATAESARCQPMGVAFSQPISISVGTILCNGVGQHEARVDRISSHGVAFKVSGAPDFTCTPDNVCQFDWRGSPSPYFRVVIDEAGGGRPTSARIMPGR